MSSVNSPACLLARNHFYRNVSPTDKMKPVYSVPGNFKQSMQSQVIAWGIVPSPQGVPGQETKGLVINVIMRNLCPSLSSSKRLNPADPEVK